MAGLYLLGIVIGILIAFLYNGTLFKGEPVPFVMELPNYRLPGVKNVAQLLWEKAKDFLQKAFSVILVATIVVWFLQRFDLQLNMVEDSAHSILAIVAGFIAPLLSPLGLGDWRIVTSLLSGFMAKESVVSTLGVLFNGNITAANCDLQVGTGTIDIQRIIDAAEKYTVAEYMVLEQDFSKYDEIESINISMNSFKRFQGVEF